MEPSRRRAWLWGGGGVVATLLSFFGGMSTSDISREVARMTIISPAPEEIAVVRDMAHKYYSCPAETVTIYVIARVEHITNVTQIGIRCQ